TGSLGMSGNGPRTLTLTGPGTSGDTLACNITNHPAGTSLTKSGSGLWILTGTNTYAGGTALLGGTLQVGTGAAGVGGPSGALGSGNISTVAGTSIDFQRSGTLIVPGAISGGGSVSQDGSGTVILANNNGYTGGTTINTGTLQVGNGGGSGSLDSASPIINNSLLIFNTAGSFTYQGAGLISGSGNVIVQGGGTTKAVGANSYTGWTRIDAGTTFWPREGQDGALATSVITNNGILRIVEQNSPAGFTYNGPIVGSGAVQIGANNVNVGQVTFLGTNTYTGGTFIGGNMLVLGDNATDGSGAIAGNVTFTSNFTIGQDNPRTLAFNRPDSFTFSGNIVTNFATPQSNLGIVQQNGSGTLTLTGNNTYGGGTVVNGGFLVIGNGGSSGSVGFGSVSLVSGNPLVINRTGSLTIWDNISGTADLVINGGGTVTLNGTNNGYGGVTTVNNGTLIVNGTNITTSTHVITGGLGGAGTFTGPITLDPTTTFLPGAGSSVGTLTVQSDLTLDSTNIMIDINKLASPSNDIVNVSGVLTRNATGGTLTVHNRGPQDLAPGDKFTIFNQPLTNGASITVTGGRATWVNNLAVDGSISVSTVITVRPTLNWGVVSGTNLVFSWSDPFGSFQLQAQTNKVGISNNWANFPGGSTPPVTVRILPANPPVFFRLISVP
ncbi:MAG TPA: autotransporter-associated beta strand repeat-containing protein, partial [Candidatus Acidoferrum sp.]|nr:autotransporter-associated beta strand repeat-containing protein [Candidatus Acidoferrum sp.]